MERYIINNFKINVKFEDIITRLKLTEPDDISEFKTYFDEAMAVACPKAVYRVCYIDGIDGDAVTIDGVAMHSQVMVGNFKELHRVFAYVVTCGQEINEYVHGVTDFVVAMWLDTLKEMILYDAVIQFRELIKTRYGIAKLSSMNPGSGNIDTWPIEQQVNLFELIGNVTEDIGVALTESKLMEPNKSVSGIQFPSDKEYVNCALCRRENCVNRSAEYDPSLPGAV